MTGSEETIEERRGSGGTSSNSKSRTERGGEAAVYFRGPPDGVDAAEWGEVSESLRGVIREVVLSRAWPLYLFGGVGRGKTCAMAALYRRSSASPIWWTASEIISQIQRCRSSRSGTIEVVRGERVVQRYEKHIWREIESDRLVCLDDIGIKSPTPTQYEILYDLVNRRGNKPTIYTSNLPGKELAAVYDTRVASRIMAGTVVEVTGVDRRITGKIIRVRGD